MKDVNNHSEKCTILSLICGRTFSNFWNFSNPTERIRAPYLFILGTMVRMTRELMKKAIFKGLCDDYFEMMSRFLKRYYFCFILILHLIRHYFQKVPASSVYFNPIPRSLESKE